MSARCWDRRRAEQRRRLWLRYVFARPGVWHADPDTGSLVIVDEVAEWDKGALR